MSMTADVCDLDELATGKRREGIFGAIYWWMVKLGFAIAGLLSGAIMSLRRLHAGRRRAARRARWTACACSTPACPSSARCWRCGSCATTTWTRSAPRRCTPSSSGASSAPARRSSQGSGARPWLAEHGLLLPGVEPSPLAGKTARRDPRAVRRAVAARPVRPVLQRLRRGAARGRPAAGIAGRAGASTSSRRTRAGCAPSPAPRGTS